MDSYAYLRPMAQLMEVQCLGGKLMLSSLNLHQLQAWPECRALQNAIYMYMGSDDFRPDQEMSAEEIRALVK